MIWQRTNRLHREQALCRVLSTSGSSRCPMFSTIRTTVWADDWKYQHLSNEPSLFHARCCLALWLYPSMKRLMYWPSLFLGITFLDEKVELHMAPSPKVGIARAGKCGEWQYFASLTTAAMASRHVLISSNLKILESNRWWSICAKCHQGIRPILSLFDAIVPILCGPVLGRKMTRFMWWVSLPLILDPLFTVTRMVVSLWRCVFSSDNTE